MVMLCAGVILAGSTFHGFATSYDVSARVDAPLPTGPAIISQPSNQIHTTETQIDVNGTCPLESYVIVYRDGQSAGVSPCTGTTFHARVDLAMGENQLQAKVYNVTNQEGPVSSAVTVFRDPIPEVPTVPIYIPITLQIQSVDRNDFNGTSTPHTSDNPTVSGFAPPFSAITIVFHSDPVECRTKADGAGWWTCTLSTALPGGTHHVDITAKTPDGQTLTYPTFEIIVLPQLPSLIPARQSIPVIGVDYRYQTHYAGQPFSWNLAMKGGTPPFKIIVNWGDGSESTFIRNDNKPFTITHSFPQKQTYTIFAKSVDANGTTSTMQLFATTKGEDGTVAATTKPGPLILLLAMVQQYLWIVWPAYIAVLLMVLSYWLGEKEMYLRFMARRMAHHSGGKGRRV